MQQRHKVYLETYGCQMNVADSEIVLSILKTAGFEKTEEPQEADVLLVNTCAVREHAETRVYGRLGDFGFHKKGNPGIVIGMLGCMAERLRKELLESETLVDFIVGPDEYRRLPEMIEHAFEGERGVAVRLSRVETYDDIAPLRTEGISAWISVMRGCDKFCTFCVVPYTRGRERSRSLQGIVREVADLAERGFKEVTLLGQNVNSYRDGERDFADLLAAAAAVDSGMRVRFTTSHPQDMSDKLIETIAAVPNLCPYIHLPVQSGSDRILELMNRTYTRDHYVRLTEKIKKTIPNVSLSTDIIAGFPTETDEDHRATMDVMREVEYDGAFMFKYSRRDFTKAAAMADDVPDEAKTDRLTQIIDLQRAVSLRRNRALIGTTADVLIEGESKRSSSDLMGRTDTNRTVIFPRNGAGVGETIPVRIERANSATLFGSPLHEK